MCSLSLAFSAAMQLYQGQQANKTAKANAKIAQQQGRYNQRLADNEATKIANQGTEEENDLRRAMAELSSDQKASLGAAGVQTDSGSALQVQEDTVNLGEADIATSRANFFDRVQAKEQEGKYARWQGKAQADQYKAQGKSALIGGALGAASSVVSSQWFTSKSAGLFGGGSPKVDPRNVAPSHGY